MFKKIAAAVALVAASSAAFAAEPAPYYVGVEASTTKIENLDDKFGGGIYAGYKINQNIAVEAGYSRLLDSDMNIGGVKADTTADQMSLSLVGTLPLADGFNIFGRIGYNRVDLETKVAGAKIKDHSNNALYGIGLGYTFTPAITGRIEVQKPDSNITKLAVGVAYNF